MPDLTNGERRSVQSSSGRTYELFRSGGIFSCSCPAWRNQSRNPNARTCKHLEAERGAAVERARLAYFDRTGNVQTVADNGTGNNLVTRGHQPPSTPVRIGTKATKQPTAPKEAPRSVWDRLAGDDLFDEPKPAILKTTGDFVLLAESWDGISDPTGLLMSEKYDGVRAVWDPESKALYSRLQNKFHAPSWFTENWTEMALDGELWWDHGKFQETVGIVRTADPDQEQMANAGWGALSFLVFDAPEMPGPFTVRINRLNSLRRTIKNKYITIVEQTICRGKSHLEEYLAEVEARGGEGVMLRDPNSTYVRGRSNSLLKVKSFLDSEVKIVGYTSGKGKHAGKLGAYDCVTLPRTISRAGKTFNIPDGKTFSVGTGLSDHDRSNPLPVGSIIKVRFQELTKDQKPRFPSYLGPRED